MTFDAFALVGEKLEQASKHLTEMGQVIIRDRQAVRHGVAYGHEGIASVPT